MGMEELKRAKESFRFYTRLHLSELTGLKASTLSQLLGLLKKVPDSSIYHHTHRFLQQHQYLSPEPPNDFAYWIAEILGADELGEQVASIDTIQFSKISNLRKKIITTIDDYLKNNRSARRRFVKEGEEFHFMKSVSFVLPTNHVAYDLRTFAKILKKITLDSIYFHIFEAHLRLERRTNDFSHWIETSLGYKELADEIAKLDPYTQSMEDLRNRLVRIVESKED
jgi:hypothetical protein